MIPFLQVDTNDDAQYFDFSRVLDATSRHATLNSSALR
jgi:hypothetical protein